MSIKDEILDTLERERGRAVSGQSLADQLGVSRSAVWKAVRSLRTEGYDISSATNLGYTLSQDCDKLSEAAVRAGLEDKGLPICILDSVDSTSSEAKRRAAAGQKRVLVISDTQTGGRGRSGKRFFSPAGSGLYMSLAMSTGMNLADAVGMTAYAAVCTAMAIEDATGLKCGIKWVNDLYLGNKKVCGILTEAVTDLESGGSSELVVGIGVNIKPHPLPPELENVVGFLDRPLLRPALAANIVNRLLRYDGRDRSYMDFYRERSVVIGRRVSFVSAGRRRSGTAVDIDDSGELIVETAGGREILRSGEISLESIEGIK